MKRKSNTAHSFMGALPPHPIAIANRAVSNIYVWRASVEILLAAGQCAFATAVVIIRQNWIHLRGFVIETGGSVCRLAPPISRNRALGADHDDHHRQRRTNNPSTRSRRGCEFCRRPDRLAQQKGCSYKAFASRSRRITIIGGYIAFCLCKGRASMYGLCTVRPACNPVSYVLTRRIEAEAGITEALLDLTSHRPLDCLSRALSRSLALFASADALNPIFGTIRPGKSLLPAGTDLRKRTGKMQDNRSCLSVRRLGPRRR